MNRPHQMSRPQSRVGFGRGREVSGTARHNILANFSRVSEEKSRVKVIRHTKCESFPQGEQGESGKSAADIVVEPDVAGFTYDDLKRAGDLIRSGQVAMRQANAES